MHLKLSFISITKTSESYSELSNQNFDQLSRISGTYVELWGVEFCDLMLEVGGCEADGPEPFCAHHGAGNVERRWRHGRGRWGASPFWAGAVVVEIVAARVRWDLIFVAWQSVTVTLVVTVQTGRHVVGWCRHGRRPTWRCWWRNFDFLQTWKKIMKKLLINLL